MTTTSKQATNRKAGKGTANSVNNEQAPATVSTREQFTNGIVNDAVSISELLHPEQAPVTNDSIDFEVNRPTGDAEAPEQAPAEAPAEAPIDYSALLAEADETTMMLINTILTGKVTEAASKVLKAKANEVQAKVNHFSDIVKRKADEAQSLAIFEREMQQNGEQVNKLWAEFTAKYADGFVSTVNCTNELRTFIASLPKMPVLGTGGKSGGTAKVRAKVSGGTVVRKSDNSTVKPGSMAEAVLTMVSAAPCKFNTVVEAMAEKFNDRKLINVKQSVNEYLRGGKLANVIHDPIADTFFIQAEAPVEQAPVNTEAK